MEIPQRTDGFSVCKRFDVEDISAREAMVKPILVFVRMDGQIDRVDVTSHGSELDGERDKVRRAQGASERKRTRSRHHRARAARTAAS